LVVRNRNSPSSSRVHFLNRKIHSVHITCNGEDIGLPLSNEQIPERARSLILIINDPDAPGRTGEYWIDWNISPAGRIAENSTLGAVGKSSF
jgi:phosphatidylethanolamine-binding protein (PEBP) family uncharacterized protein